MTTKTLSITRQPYVNAHSSQTVGAVDPLDSRNDPYERETLDHFADLGDIIELKVEAIAYNDSEEDPIDLTYQWQRVEGVEGTEGEEIGVTKLQFVNLEGETGDTLEINVNINGDTYEKPYRCIVGTVQDTGVSNSNSITIKRYIGGGPYIADDVYDVKAHVGYPVGLRITTAQNTGGRYHAYLCKDSAVVSDPNQNEPVNPLGAVSTGYVAVGGKYIAPSLVVPSASAFDTDYHITVHDQYGENSTSNFEVALEDGVRVITVGNSGNSYGYIDRAGDRPVNNGSAIDYRNYQNRRASYISSISADSVTNRVLFEGISLIPGGTTAIERWLDAQGDPVDAFNLTFDDGENEAVECTVTYGGRSSQGGNYDTIDEAVTAYLVAAEGSSVTVTFTPA